MTELDWKTDGTLRYYIPEDLESRPGIAAFDMDWTLSYGERHIRASDPDDIKLLPDRFERLQELHDQGFYNVVIFTNQQFTKAAVIMKALSRVETLLREIGFPCGVFVATGKDKQGQIDPWRKPQPGMWHKMVELYGQPTSAFYVGDAMGRPQDFSDSDLCFAQAVGVAVKTPEQYFGHRKPAFKPSEKDLIIFVGMQGSGKTTTYNEFFRPLGIRMVSRDVCKKKEMVLAKLSGLMEDGQSVVVDNTNPSLEDRQVFFDLAEKYGHKVTVVYFLRDGRGWNKLRPEHKRVDTKAYISFFCRLDPPTEDNTPGDLIYVT